MHLPASAGPKRPGASADYSILLRTMECQRSQNILCRGSLIKVELEIPLIIFHNQSRFLINNRVALIRHPALVLGLDRGLVCPERSRRLFLEQVDENIEVRVPAAADADDLVA